MKQNLPVLKHILDEIKFLLRETRGISCEDFISNELLKRGCARSIEVMGEAAKNLSNELREKHKEVDWKNILIRKTVII